jgi:hypothetical protein
MDRVSIPFSRTVFDPTGGGLSQQSFEGLVRVEADQLVVEFREKVTDWSGMTKASQGEIRVVRIPLDDVEAVEVAGWLFWTRLVLRAHSLTALAGIDWANGAEVVFNVPFRARHRARELGATTMLNLLDRTIQSLDTADHRRLEGGPTDGTAP